MNELSWVISGEGCTHVEKGLSFCLPTQGSLGVVPSLIPSFCPFASWAFGSGPTLNWASPSGRPQTGHEQAFRPHPSLNRQPLMCRRCSWWLGVPAVGAQPGVPIVARPLWWLSRPCLPPPGAPFMQTVMCTAVPGVVPRGSLAHHPPPPDGICLPATLKM